MSLPRADTLAPPALLNEGACPCESALLDWLRHSVSRLRFLLWVLLHPAPSHNASLHGFHRSITRGERSPYGPPAMARSECCGGLPVVHSRRRASRKALGVRVASELWLIGLSRYEDRKGHRGRWAKLGQYPPRGTRRGSKPVCKMSVLGIRVAQQVKETARIIAGHGASLSVPSSDPPPTEPFATLPSCHRSSSASVRDGRSLRGTSHASPSAR